MPIKVSVKKSTNPKKKYMAVMEAPKFKKTVHFGAAGMSDYTKHKDPARKERYIERHQARENWSDPRTSGFWSRWMLWNKPTLSASKTDAIKRAKSALKKMGI